MPKKIIDVPDNATSMRVTFENEKALRVTNFKVADLPDVPTVAKNATVDRHVIELPAYAIQNLKAWKEDAGSVMVFLNYTQIISNDDLRESIFNVTNTDMLAEWYLGYIDFVAEKEPQYRVITHAGQYVKQDDSSEDMRLVYDKLVGTVFNKENAFDIVNQMHMFGARLIEVETDVD